MSTIREDTIDIEEVVQLIVETAEELKTQSKGSISEEVLGPLQFKQDELIQELQRLERNFRRRHKGPIEEFNAAAWKRIQRDIEKFQTLNNTFINNLSVRQGLIQFDLNEVKKTQRSVAKLKGSYGESVKKTAAISNRRPGQFNTLS